MRRFLQILHSIMQAMARSFRVVMRPVLRAGRWTIEAIVEPVARGVEHAAEAVTDAVDYAVSLPGKVLGGLFRRGGGGAGQQAAAHAAQTTEQARAAQAAAEKALTVQQTARLLQRACRWRADGRDISDLVTALPSGLGGYVQKLNTDECMRLAEMDTKTLVDWLSGCVGSLPGVRSPDEIAVGQDKDLAPAPVRTSSEQHVLGELSERLLRRIRLRKRAEANTNDDYAA